MTSPDSEQPPIEIEGCSRPATAAATSAQQGEALAAGENSRLAAALRYASYGWHVFPCKAGAKEPITAHGHLDATTGRAAIAAWWKATPGANIGVALKASGLAVLDVDPRNGGDDEALDRACDLGSPLTQRTGGGGVHYVYADRGVELRSSLSYAGLDGIDVKRDGYIIVAPSVTLGPYEWTEWPEDDEGNVALDPMTATVLDLTRAPSQAARDLAIKRTEALNDREQAYIDAALNDACVRLASTPEGSRHAAVYYTARALGEYVGGGVLPRERARQRVTQAAEQLYGEALWRVEEKTIEQGLDKGEREPRGIPDEHDGARRLLARITEASDPMAIIELYSENNPELLRAFGASALDDERTTALVNVYGVGGDDAVERAVRLIVAS